MSQTVEEITELLNMLPDEEQTFALELMRKLIIAWDPDFTKLTPKEAAELEEARKGPFIRLEDIDWDSPE